jgi:hypothetical protein
MVVERGSAARRLKVHPLIEHNPSPPIYHPSPSHRDGLPLHVRGRVRTSAGKRDDVVLYPAGTGAARAPGRWARVAQLELALDGAGRCSLVEAENGRGE